MLNRSDFSADDHSSASKKPSQSLPQTQMRVQKRNKTYDPVDLNKIVRAISTCCDGLQSVDSIRVATRTIAGLYDGATTAALDELSIQTAASFIAEEPEYSFLAGRMLSRYIEKEVGNQNIWSFSQSIERGYEEGIINDTLLTFVKKYSRKLNHAIQTERNNLFRYLMKIRHFS